jgi:hypothetical protein
VKRGSKQETAAQSPSFGHKRRSSTVIVHVFLARCNLAP